LHLFAIPRFLWATCPWFRYSFHKALHIPSML
jgi:hypothetical protein